MTAKREPLRRATPQQLRDALLKSFDTISNLSAERDAALSAYDAVALMRERALERLDQALARTAMVQLAVADAQPRSGIRFDTWPVQSQDLLEALGAGQPCDAIDGQANTCRHDSATGIDLTEVNNPNKVWRCDHCGLRWTAGDA